DASRADEQLLGSACRFSVPECNRRRALCEWRALAGARKVCFSLAMSASAFAATCDEYRHRKANQFGCHRRNASIVAFSPPEFDRNILMLGVAGFVEATAKCGNYSF